VSTHAATSMRRYGYRAGAALPLLAAAAVMTAGLGLQGPLRAVVELPLALVLPGAAILAAARGSRPARPASDIGLAVVFSFAAWILITLVCFIFNQTLTTTAYIVAADALVAASAAVCLRRRTPVATLVGAGASRGRITQLVLFALTAGICIGVIAIGTRSGPAPQPYTQLTLVGQWANLKSSVAVTPGAKVAVPVSVSNHTGAPQTYLVVPTMRGADWSTRTVELLPGATWRGEVQGTVPRGGCLHRLLVEVRESSVAAPIGNVTVWFQNGTTLPKKCTP
jgi:hypothetical protein